MTFSVIDRREKSGISHSSLNSTQIQQDQIGQHFQATMGDVSSFVAMSTGAFAFRFSRFAFLNTAAKLGVIQKASPLLLKGSASLFGLGVEVSAFRATTQSLASLSGHLPEQETFHADAWRGTFVEFAALKLFSPLGAYNPFLAHFAQANAMVLGREFSADLGFTTHETGSYVQKLAHAEATNIAMSAGAAAFGLTTAGNFQVLEKTLDLYAESAAFSNKQIPKLERSSVKTLHLVFGADGVKSLSDIALVRLADHLRMEVTNLAWEKSLLANAVSEGREISPEILFRKDGFVDYFLRIAKGRGSQAAIDQAEAAFHFMKNPETRQIGILQMLAIVEDTMRDYHNPNIEKPYQLPTPPEEMRETVEHVVALDRDHPGFRDEAYRNRRNLIADIAASYAPATLTRERGFLDVPEAPYVVEEHAVWANANDRLGALHLKYACREYLEARQRFLIAAQIIPQLKDLNARLLDITGFQMIPVAGLVTTRAFLSTLSSRLFLSTQYIRHHSKPEYTPEPDVIHELIGHVAFLADPQMAALNQLFGEAVARARTEQEVTHLGNLYWWSLEYGALMENGVPKAYGAGLFSAFGELPRVADLPLLPFDPQVMERTPFDPTRMQPFFFAAPSFAEMVRVLREHLQRWPG